MFHKEVRDISNVRHNRRLKFLGGYKNFVKKNCCQNLEKYGRNNKNDLQLDSKNLEKE